MASDSTERDAYQEFFDPKTYMDLQLSTTGDCGDTVMFTLEQLCRVFASGVVKGGTLIEIGAGPTILSLLSASDAFSEIIVTDYTDRNLQELEKWRNRDQKAYDLSSYSQLVCTLEGNRQTWLEKEETLRRAISKVLKCDITQSNPLAPIFLDPVDCVLSTYCLENVCSDETTFYAYLKNMTSVLKPGGHLVLSVLLECTYYLVGKHRFPTFFTTDGFVRAALTDLGFAIEEFNLSPHHGDYADPQTDHRSALFVVAHKGRENPIL